MASREEFDNLYKRVEELENLVKALINASLHTHDWESTGYHCDQNVERKCLICGLHEKYVYPGCPYENIWEKVN
jgi:hypothetical protein